MSAHPYDGEPILQVLGSKCFNNPNVVRYLSDGQYTEDSPMLASQLNYFFDQKQLPVFTINKVKKYNTVPLSNSGMLNN